MFQILTLLIATFSSTYSISIISGKGGLDNVGIGTFQNLGSYNSLLNSPPVETLYNGDYLKGFDFSQLGSQSLGADLGAQTFGSYQNQQNLDGSSFLSSFRSGAFTGNAYNGDSIGLGAYGSSSGINSIKFSPQPVQSISPPNTRLTSSPIQVSYPNAAVPVSGYRPAYPPYRQVDANPIPPSPISLGSGSLGITRLNNGNFALGSGSIGYGGSPPIVGQRAKIQQQIPIF
ncbi:hypothetical protein Trydic_g18229 [Trypoxylus dichotomus]